MRPSRPDDPALGQVARSIDATRGAAHLIDAECRLIWVSNELQVLLEAGVEELGIGRHIVEAYMSPVWSRAVTAQSQLTAFNEEFPFLMHDTPGGKTAFAAMFKNALSQWPGAPDYGDLPEASREEIVDQIIATLEPAPPPLVWSSTLEYLQADLPPVRVTHIHVRLVDPARGLLGTLVLYDPGLSGRVLTMVARGDEAMYERMVRLTRPGRRKAAILFADLQSSAELSRMLPSAAYFKLMRALTTALDEVVVSHRGIVGKHAGDGVTAFFTSDDLGSASAAARAALEAARAMGERTGVVAKEIGDETGLIDVDHCRVNIGVHWGGTLYMGQLVTGGRLEVTALGDQVNECARIQATARDGAALASKSLIEQLEREDAQALGIDPDAVVYRTIGQIPGAPDKAKRDAGTIPVTSI